MQIPIGISGRHLHLSRDVLDALFGVGYELQMLRPLSQAGQFAARERVKIIGPQGEFPHVRVVGPLRTQTQVEISRTDARQLGINPPVRVSRDLLHTPGLLLVGPAGEFQLPQGVILATRHVHMNIETAAMLGVRERDTLALRIPGERPTVFEQVIARVSPAFSLELHIDTDDANAIGLAPSAHAELVKIVPFSL
jgi:propanediol utilization protein